MSKPTPLSINRALQLVASLESSNVSCDARACRTALRTPSLNVKYNSRSISWGKSRACTVQRKSKLKPVRARKISSSALSLRSNEPALSSFRSWVSVSMLRISRMTRSISFSMIFSSRRSDSWSVTSWSRHTSALNLTLDKICNARSWSSREIRWRSRTRASATDLRSSLVLRTLLSLIDYRFTLHDRLSRQMPGQKLQSSWPSGLIRMTAIARAGMVHKGMGGVRIRIELVLLIKFRKLKIELAHILLGGVRIIGAEVTLDRATNFRSPLKWRGNIAAPGAKSVASVENDGRFKLGTGSGHEIGDSAAHAKTDYAQAILINGRLRSQQSRRRIDIIDNLPITESGTARNDIV